MCMIQEEKMRNEDAHQHETRFFTLPELQDANQILSDHFRIFRTFLVAALYGENIASEDLSDATDSDEESEA